MITNGFKNLMKQVLSSGGTSQGLLPIVDVSGTTRYLADYTAYPYTVNTTFATTAAGAGISVGSGNAASTENTYQLANTITSGLSGTVTVSKTVDVNSNSTIVLELALTNTSGSDITISEIGYKQEFSASSTQSGTSTDDYVFLIDRTVLSSPATVTAGGSAVITYSLTTKFGASSGVQDVEVDGVSVVTGGVAEIDLTGKQDTLIAGTNITIAADGKTISATGGTTVVANPSGTATGDLNSVQIGSTIYDIPSSGGGTTVIPNPVGTPTDDLDTIQIGNTIYDIVGSGGTGLPYTCDLLFENDPLPSPTSGTSDVTRTYTLSNSIEDYDAVYIIGYGYHTSNGNTNIMPMLVLKRDYYIFGFDNNGYYQDSNNVSTYRMLMYKFTDSTHISTYAMRSESGNEPILYKVYGLKFSSSIISPLIYSEQEREIGVYVDGKPLYQKTFVSIPQSQNYNIDVSGLNIDKLVSRQGTITRDVGGGSYQQKDIEYRTESATYNAYGFGVELRDTNLSIDLYSYSYAQITEIRITIQYTKTTDTPGSGTWTPTGQFAHVYSTTEHIVGKWIDGSDVYECTWDFGSDISCLANTWTTTSISNTGINRIIGYNATSSSGTYRGNLQINCDNTGVGYIQISSTDNISVRYLTLSYTKSA